MLGRFGFTPRHHYRKGRQRILDYIIAVPFMGRIVKVQGMALATFACLAKANIILHLTVD
jgi:hypothetical protein